MSAPAEELKLFEAPDLTALQRNWPRIALRASVLVLVPFCVTMLARSLDLYAAIRSLPLPLDLLAAGPFAYEAKVIFAIVATFLALAFLMPKRTPQIVMAVCVAGVVWTGHVYISLQWARLFASQFNFRRDSVPEPAAWFFATLLLTVGVVFLLLENLLDTRAQQESRGLAKEEARALLDVGWRTLGLLAGLGAALAAALLGSYLLLRAALRDVSLPFRLNPVFVLLGMGIVLALVVGLAVGRRSPVEDAPDVP